MSHLAAQAVGALDRSRRLRPRSLHVFPFGTATAWTILSALGLIIGVTWEDPRAPVCSASLSLTGLGGLAALLLSGRLGVRRSLAEVRLGPWAAVGFAVGYGAANLVWLTGYYDPSGRSTLSNVADSWPVVAVGFVAMVMGYIAFGFRSRDDVHQDVASAPQASINGCLALWAIAMVARVVQFATGAVGYLTTSPSGGAGSFSAILATVPGVGIVATTLAAREYTRRRSVARLLALILISSSQFTIGLFAAQKQDALVQLVGLAIGLSTGRKLRIGAVVVAALAALFFIAPFVSEYRSILVANGRSMTPAQVLSQVDFKDLVLHGGSGSSGDSNQSSLLARMAHLGDASIIVRQTPGAIPYQSWEPVAQAPLASVIPRAVWPGKPLLNQAQEVYRVYYGATVIASSPAVTPYADGYRRGGYTVLIVLLFFTGLVTRLIDDYRPAGDLGLVIPLLLLAMWVKQETDLAGMAATILPTIVLGLVTTRLLAATSEHDLS